jgi:transposase InsO family protein
VRAKYEFIDAQKAYYPVVKMCTWLGVSRSGFYEWLDRGTSATARRRQELCLLIAKAFTDSDGTYGHRRVHAQLTRWGVQVSLELVRALMRALGLQPCQPRPWRPTTTVAGAAGPIPDLLDRDFTATTPGTKLVGDITYIPTWEGFLYLATVIDLCTKECVGYAIADHMRTELVTDALDMAARNHRLTTGAVFHTDRGSQYTSAAFAEHCSKLHVTHSVGRTGVCFDNAAAESFNAAVKVERVNRTAYPTRKHARKDITRYIELRYNTRRLHSALGYRTPREAYNDYINTHTAA